MKTIKPTGKNSEGKIIILDDDDYEKYGKYRWQILVNGYAARNMYVSKNKTKRLRLHRLIINAKENERVDHINGNKLDNQKSNLRICTQQENSWNRKPFSSSGYKGAYFNKLTKKWFTSITCNGKKTQIYGFSTPEEAAKEYNRLSLEFFGEFNYLNRI